MSELGDLLELMHGARNRFERVTCEYRTWRHDERLDAAFRADAERAGRSILTAYGPERDEPRPAEHEERIRLWLERPDKARSERMGEDRPHSYGVRVGTQWWSYDKHWGAQTNEGDESAGDPSDRFASFARRPQLPIRH
jgi:hypothetical protein